MRLIWEKKSLWPPSSLLVPSSFQCIFLLWKVDCPTDGVIRAWLHTSHRRICRPLAPPLHGDGKVTPEDPKNHYTEVPVTKNRRHWKEETSLDIHSHFRRNCSNLRHNDPFSCWRWSRPCSRLALWHHSSSPEHSCPRAMSDQGTMEAAELCHKKLSLPRESSSFQARSCSWRTRTFLTLPQSHLQEAIWPKL